MGQQEVTLNGRSRDRNYKACVGLMLLDVDFFKKVNDVYGHAAGDAVLIQVANRLQGLVREKDALVGKAPERPDASLASPWPIRSWFSSQRVPPRWLSTLALEAVSRKLTRVTTNTGITSAEKLDQGRASGQ